MALLFVEYVAHSRASCTPRRARRSASWAASISCWFLAGFALEAAALVAYGRLTQSVLPKDGPGLSKVLRIDLSTLAVSHVIPGGTAGGTGLGYRLLTSSGVSGPDAGFALATQGIGSAVVLNAMLWVALVISIPLHGFNSAYVTVAVVGAVLLAALRHARARRSPGARPMPPGPCDRSPGGCPGSPRSRWSSWCNASPPG